mmetsp:Transcript_11450/g.14583  ORF Transcript_11450/g.14583 Transcript_11450/m.14583 type:complete len:209 (+) Transcript_11450:165-791(+)
MTPSDTFEPTTTEELVSPVDTPEPSVSPVDSLEPSPPINTHEPTTLPVVIGVDHDATPRKPIFGTKSAKANSKAYKPNNESPTKSSKIFSKKSSKSSEKISETSSSKSSKLFLEKISQSSPSKSSKLFSEKIPKPSPPNGAKASSAKSAKAYQSKSTKASKNRLYVRQAPISAHEEASLPTAKMSSAYATSNPSVTFLAITLLAAVLI